MSKKVTIYTTESCSFCHLAKDYFKENKIDYKEKNVQKDADARKEMMEKSGGMAVPVIDIGGKIIIGFNKPEIEKALA
jgi:glutaredoxin 3